MVVFRRPFFVATWLLLLHVWMFQADAIVQRTTNTEEVLLPMESSRAAFFHPALQHRLTASRAWQAFVDQNGAWAVQWNEATGTPHRAFGPAVPIQGVQVISQANVEAAARQFLKTYAPALKLDPDQLRLLSAHQVEGRWYVHFDQLYQSLPVLFSEVELRISSRGKVMALGVDFYPIEELEVSPTLTEAQALASARKGLSGQVVQASLLTQPLAVLPLRRETSVEYRLVYQVQVLTRDPLGNYLVLVDAHSGELLWRYNRVRYAGVEGQVQSLVQLVEPTDTFTVVNNFSQYVTVDGNQVVTDSLGWFSANTLGNFTANFTLQGPFVNVNRDDGPDASLSLTGAPGDTLLVLWDDSTSHPAERDAFYHVNIAHRYVTTLDTGFTTINYSMPCRVNISDVCNAFWDGNGVNFFQAGGGCPNTGQMPSVVYHEYGHGVNDRLYEQLGSTFGMVNAAVHEGTADVLSAMIEDDPRIGRGFFGPGTHLRNVQNTNRYPDDVSGDPHITGLILAGAFWDIRLSTDLATARYLSHFAKHGLPDDPNDGIAFSEWFVETLVADDDDGDLSNGTPHFTQIVDAFNQHGIGTSLFMLLSFSHTPLPDTQLTTGHYNVNFNLSGAPLPGSQPDSVQVVFSVDNFQTATVLDASPTFQGQFNAQIPAQPAGTIVQYYITARDPISQTVLTFPAGAPAAGAYTFLVGFNQVLLDELEAPSGWKVGAPDDNATTGIWERADPQQTTVGGLVVQPENDHTATGTQCFVTGATAGSSAGFNDVDNGKTTLFSPVLDLSNLDEPVIRYWKWYSNDKGAAPGQDFWVVDISNDSGQTWVNVENTNQSTDGWEKFQFRVADYVQPSRTVMLRFVASDFAPGSLVEGLVDDFEILARGVITGINTPQAGDALPRRFELAQNFPNPFNPSTSIRVALPQAARVQLVIYNALGQEVRRLADGVLDAGYHTFRWDGTGHQGAALPSGIYFYRMEARPLNGQKTVTQVRKLLLLR
ncbi:MAG: T9SS C-terminal target domain-containing protein [Calditrichaeota bacterium]|nr:MAG: T9SS C-terminal target domain-containing protein [Calditrichota bacterium]